MKISKALYPAGVFSVLFPLFISRVASYTPSSSSENSSKNTLVSDIK